MDEMVTLVRATAAKIKHTHDMYSLYKAVCGVEKQKIPGDIASFLEQLIEELSTYGIEIEHVNKNIPDLVAITTRCIKNQVGYKG